MRGSENEQVAEPSGKSRGDQWLSGVRRVPSPNRDDRPPGSEISLLVIHNISLPPGEYDTGYIDALFTNRLDDQQHPALEDLKDVRVSSHLMIDRSARVTQYVPFNARAWHAGRSRYQGRDNCNDFAIGIELEGVDDQPYESVQYARLTAVTVTLLRRYPRLSLQAIVGHCEVAPDRKTDPGPAFNWPGYLSSLRQALV